DLPTPPPAESVDTTPVTPPTPVEAETPAASVGDAPAPLPTQPQEAPVQPDAEEPAPPLDPAEAVRAADELLEAGDIYGAEALYLRLTQDDYQSSYAHDGLARARFLAGSLEEAATTLQVAASIEPENFLFQFNLGITLHLLERHAEAIEAFQKAVN